jgi:hypothetical protein
MPYTTLNCNIITYVIFTYSQMWQMFSWLPAGMAYHATLKGTASWDGLPRHTLKALPAGMAYHATL